MTRPTYDSAIAYFSMEICLEQGIPTYSGGLGVLAGDTLRSAADLELPVVGITLLHRKGYFRQHLDDAGQQTEAPVEWDPSESLELLAPIVTVQIAGHDVRVRAWKYSVRGVTGGEVPVLLLDTGLPENEAWDQALTDQLYGGDTYYRLCQEVVLGMGGAGMLRALGYTGTLTYHMNEGHAALVTLTLLEQQLDGRQSFEVNEGDLDAVERHCVFTTHTPVPAGHDKFPSEMVRQVLGDERHALLEKAQGVSNGELNMTHLALHLSRFVNGVAMRHRDVSQGMFPNFPVNSVTNGVHAVTWTHPAFRALYDRRIPEWRHDNNYLRYAVGIPLTEVQEAHDRCKEEFIAEVQRRTGVPLDPKVFTIGFARRATPYKRADLIFSDPERLARIAREVGPLQIVYGGKAHPHDTGGKELIKRIHEAATRLSGQVRVVYLENYEMTLAQVMIPGVDLWLNNPMKPLEASGTSGMKAAINGVPQLSVLDGWWIEGHVENVTGWSIGSGIEPESDPMKDASDLYLKLERAVLPLYYGLPMAYAEMRRHAISLNGSFFNTQRMVEQYVRNAYWPQRVVEREGAAVG